jgi:hypothetical protein
MRISFGATYTINLSRSSGLTPTKLEEAAREISFIDGVPVKIEYDQVQSDRLVKRFRGGQELPALKEPGSSAKLTATVSFPTRPFGLTDLVVDPFENFDEDAEPRPPKDQDDRFKRMLEAAEAEFTVSPY